MKVSILMAVYNAEKWVGKAIESVINQSYDNWELICMNDGSTDNSLELLQDYADKDSRIRVYSYKHCGIHAVYLNKGILLAKGEFVYSLDSDDWISSDLLLELLKRQSETGADFVISDMCRIDEKGNELSCIIGCLGDRNAIITGRQAVVHSLDWSIHTLGIIKKEIAASLPFDEDGYSVEVTARRRLLACKKIAFSRGTYYYLQNTQAITKRFGVRKFYYVMIDVKMLRFLKENGFETKVQEMYYADSLRRLIAAQILYAQRYKELSQSDRQKVSSYVRTAFRYLMQQTELFKATKNALSVKQRCVLTTKQQWLFNLYCYLRK